MLLYSSIFFASLASLASLALNILHPVKINHFEQIMQNEPNLRKDKMNINYYKKRDYKENCGCEDQKNEPKRTQFLPTGRRRIKINHFDQIMQNKPNFKNDKMTINYYTKTNYKEKTHSRQRKNKPNQTQFKRAVRDAISDKLGTDYWLMTKKLIFFSPKIHIITAQKIGLLTGESNG